MFSLIWVHCYRKKTETSWWSFGEEDEEPWNLGGSKQGRSREIQWTQLMLQHSVQLMESRTRFTGGLWIHNSILEKNCMKTDNKFRSQTCTCHDSWAVMTCANLWPHWIIGIMIKTKRHQDSAYGLINCFWNGSRWGMCKTGGSPLPVHGRCILFFTKPFFLFCKFTTC